ncbi:uncharacterized protein BO66DRAFT_393672 [Aspergillus aculeatinus CBS 121060]|uniref:Uncharacterized protein n=1 Tax=Aspergillus aculeatinus CBS 121060 TaxID=1448322 RepID=A0ACD1H1U9_9EURO|nr:hypothetical protein BO66DRAFT_393672 [Aspergillus aculeatinus CBS 121060]RAH67711.1 hypothetical protein BO66DRAFT_393672 [Aspergillus aculeatinus CBS 121060]
MRSQGHGQEKAGSYEDRNSLISLVAVASCESDLEPTTAAWSLQTRLVAGATLFGRLGVSFQTECQ